jgi:hypothetical protein
MELKFILINIYVNIAETGNIYSRSYLKVKFITY